MDYQTRSKCVGCSSTDFSEVIDLGNQYVIDFVPAPDPNAMRAPLVLRRCKQCSLVQLKHQVRPDRLYKKFWYRSGMSESMRASLRELAISAHAAAPVKPNRDSHILDIGCNDGTMLAMYPNRYRTVGIDPCRDLVLEAASEHRMDVPIVGYFDKKAVEPYGPYSIITAVAMFYDVDNPVQFLKDCRDVLEPKGVLVIQMNYLKSMIENNTFDNISHEHLTYYSLTVFDTLVQEAGLEIQGVEVNQVNGGSIRAYITHPGATLGFDLDKLVTLHANKYSLILDEGNLALDTDVPYKAFASRAGRICGALRDYILHQKDVFIYGASTRGATIVQCLDLPQGTFKAAAERDHHKWGLYTVGTNVLIQDEDYCRSGASHFLVLPYHFMETIKRREDQWLARGGKMIVPLPNPYVLSYEDKEVMWPLMGSQEVAQ